MEESEKRDSSKFWRKKERKDLTVQMEEKFAREVEVVVGCWEVPMDFGWGQ